MLKRPWLVLIVLLALAFGIYGSVKFVLNSGSWSCKEGEWIKVGLPLSKKPTSPCLAGGKGVSEINLPNIVLSAPKPYAEVSLPLKIVGKARVFENSFNYALKDADGSVLAEGVVMSDAKEAGEFGNFEITTSYPIPKGESGMVEVFSYSAKDGSIENKVAIPVKFKNVDSMSVKVFLLNADKNPSGDCLRVFPVTRRVVKDAGVGKVSIEELLKGPYTNELSEGYSSSINNGVKLNSLTIEGGTGTVDFDRALLKGVAGSCKVTAIRAQIDGTLKQFSTITEVKITVEGEEDTVLQP